nr:hypothetical protein [uncultured Arsenicibacter sp.]
MKKEKSNWNNLHFDDEPVPVLDPDKPETPQSRVVNCIIVSLSTEGMYIKFVLTHPIPINKDYQIGDFQFNCLELLQKPNRSHRNHWFYIMKCKDRIDNFEQFKENVVNYQPVYPIPIDQANLPQPEVCTEDCSQPKNEPVTDSFPAFAIDPDQLVQVSKRETLTKLKELVEHRRSAIIKQLTRTGYIENEMLEYVGAIVELAWSIGMHYHPYTHKVSIVKTTNPKG